MISSIRNFSTSIFAKILILLITGSFIFFGIGDVVRNKAYQDDYLTIGKKNFSKEYVENAIKNEKERLEKLYPGNPNIANIPFDKLATRKIIVKSLLLQEADKVNLLFTNKAVLSDITNSPDFLTGGKFDQEKFQNVLADNNLSEAAFLTLLKEEKKVDTLKKTADLAPLNKFQNTAKIISQIENQDKIFDLYTVSYDKNELPSVTDVEAEKFYNDNIEIFSSAEQRITNIIDLSCKSFMPQVSLNEDEINQEFNYELANGKYAEKRSLDLIVLDSKEKADQAKSLLNAGNNIQDVATKLSVDITSLDAVSKHELFPEFQEKVFSKKTGEHTDIIEGDFGFSIFKVKEVSKPSSEELANLRADIINKLKHDRACEIAITSLGKIEAEIDSGEKMQEVAKKHNLELVKDFNISQDNAIELGKLLHINEDELFILFKQIFGPNNNQARIAKINDKQYALYEVTNSIPKYYPPLVEIKDEVIKRLQAKKIKEQLTLEASKYIVTSKEEKQEVTLPNNFKVTKNLRLSEHYRSEQVEPFLQQLYKLPSNYFTSARYSEQSKQATFIKIVKTEYDTEISGFAQSEAEEKISQLLNNLISESYFDYLEKSFPVNIKEEGKNAN